MVIPELAARTSQRPPIALHIGEVTRILGKTADGQPIDASTVERYLTALGAKMEKTSADTYAVTLPSWRLDLAYEIDLSRRNRAPPWIQPLRQHASILFRQRHGIALGSQRSVSSPNLASQRIYRSDQQHVLLGSRCQCLRVTTKLNRATRKPSQRGSRLSTPVARSWHAFHAGP